MISVQRFGVVCSLVVVALGLAACAEDLTLVNASWTAVNNGWQTAISAGKKAGVDAAAQPLPAIAETDTVGKEMKAKLDAALAAHKELVGQLEQVAVESKSAVDKAVLEEKIAPVQAAIDAGVAKWATLQPKLADATTAVGTAFAALKSHLEAEAAKAAAAAADPSAKDPETVKTVGGEASFGVLFDDKGAVDEAASTAVLERMVKFMNLCEALKVELIGGGKDGQAHADAVKALVVKKGVPASRFGKSAASPSDGPVVAKVAAACP